VVCMLASNWNDAETELEVWTVCLLIRHDCSGCLSMNVGVSFKETDLAWIEANPIEFDVTS
jgi:hypothetical protein